MKAEIFGDPQKTRRVVRVIAFGLCMGLIVFTVFVDFLIKGREPGSIPPQGDLLKNPWLGICVALTIVGNLIGARCHSIRGSPAWRTQRIATTLIVTFAICEGATIIGLGHVLIVGSWDAKLAPIIGGAGMALSVIRSELILSRLVNEDAGAPNL